jgi:cellulose synthase/poly-beta-1,6-N-acetylglucosamine synthase-like glycosyltransferase
MNWDIFIKPLGWLYALTNIGLAVISVNIFFLLILSFRKQPETPAIPYPDDQLPTVLVQLPVYNERYVIERLIDAAACMDYPSHKLTIQVLDDSTDDTSLLAQKRVAYYAEQGRNVQYLHRTDRSGYKAGALAFGMSRSSSDLIAVFDADFVPHQDYLRRMVPQFLAHPELGILQARWDHLNPDQNAITHIIALVMDNHFTVDQQGRSHNRLMMNFNGSCCILRRKCIEDAGGWQSDTLAEDMDLSYRAQIKGWRIDYLHDVAVPGELPASILAFKQQQFRWAKGSVQTLKKVAGPIIQSKKPLLHKMESLIHMSGYFGSPLMLLSFILSLPVAYLIGHLPYNSAILGVAALFPPLAIISSQIRLRHSWVKDILYFPFLFLMGIGISINISQAIWEALIGRKSEFVRTPKFSATDHKNSQYALPLDRTTLAEIALFFYGLGTGIYAIHRAPTLAPFIFLYTFAYGLTATIAVFQARRQRLVKRSREAPNSEYP